MNLPYVVRELNWLISTRDSVSSSGISGHDTCLLLKGMNDGKKAESTEPYVSFVYTISRVTVVQERLEGIERRLHISIFLM